MKPRINVLLLYLLLASLAPTSICLAQAAQATQAPGDQKPTKELKLDTGKEIFEAACIGCHGPQGKGQPQSTLGFEPPATYPDFTDCGGTTPERNFDWKATVHEGGPIRGFSQIMPSFAEALTLQQIDSVIAYLREQCTEAAWPRGELNLPRALVTEVSSDAGGVVNLSPPAVLRPRFFAGVTRLKVRAGLGLWAPSRARVRTCRVA